MRQLEGELGVRLVRRSTHHVALTDAGAAFLEDARRIIMRADAATISVRSWRPGNHLRLRIGYVDDGFPAHSRLRCDGWRLPPAPRACS